MNLGDIKRLFEVTLRKRFAGLGCAFCGFCRARIGLLFSLSVIPGPYIRSRTEARTTVKFGENIPPGACNWQLQSRTEKSVYKVTRIHWIFESETRCYWKKSAKCWQRV